MIHSNLSIPNSLVEPSGGITRFDAQALAQYSDEQLEFLIGFHRGSVASQEERMRRLEKLKAQGA